jgi:hypothetical protein
MQRRYFLMTSLGLLLTAPTLAAPPDAAATPGYSVSTEQLQRVVALHFPLRFPVPGVLDLDVQAPRLQMLTAQNRLSAEMTVDASGAALARHHTGTFDVDFALRYEASDHSIRACQLHLGHLRFTDLQPAAAELLGAYGSALAEQSLQEVVLHQLRPQDLVLPDAMGLQPGSITVTDQGLVIGFVAKPL